MVFSYSPLGVGGSIKTVNNTMEKKKYKAPRIEWIPLDNEISLALESSPPAGPSEGTSLVPEFKNIDPYRNNMG